MNLYFYFLVTVALICYLCVIDSNVTDWINIKINHFLVYLQLQYIKMKWKFKRF